MDEVQIANALKQWAKPDDGFREELLQRCLDVLDQNGCMELADSDLEMLAAAGDVLMGSNPPDPYDPLSKVRP